MIWLQNIWVQWFRSQLSKIVFNSIIVWRFRKVIYVSHGKLTQHHRNTFWNAIDDHTRAFLHSAVFPNAVPCRLPYCRTISNYHRLAIHPVEFCMCTEWGKTEQSGSSNEWQFLKNLETFYRKFTALILKTTRIQCPKLVKIQ